MNSTDGWDHTGPGAPRAQEGFPRGQRGSNNPILAADVGGKKGRLGRGGEEAGEHPRRAGGWKRSGMLEELSSANQASLSFKKKFFSPKNFQREEEFSVNLAVQEECRNKNC